MVGGEVKTNRVKKARMQRRDKPEYQKAEMMKSRD